MTETYTEPHVCEAEGCDSLDTQECYPNGEGAIEHYCDAHITAAGYCMNCGSFSAGTERFSAGLFPGFCDNCQDTLLAEEEDDFDEFDDDIEDEYPFADELDEDEA